MPFPFILTATERRARTGVLTTPRGDIRTPAFMPVGTAATVKAMSVDQVKATGADIILGNTYHLMLRPGPERMERLGGLHAFMGWDKPILTDSGGFQVMSLAGISKVKEEAVTFSSHIDGSKHVLSPERSIEIQADRIGADISMQLDECVAWPAEEPRARAGRHGQAWTWEGPINLKNARFAEDRTPLDPSIDCIASSGYSKAYLHHLIRADEILGKTLLSWHNIAFYQALTAAMRDAIAHGRFEAWRKAFHARHVSN